ncbi:MAG: ChaN family lipoprotein [Gemmataceae bacterium]|nr:ChaN family lipoprotein [Gemmataceae bacterium]
MLKIAIVLAAFATPFAVDEGKAAGSKELEARLRQLEKDIAAVRGLAFKSPVVAKVIPRPRDAVKGIQGYYSTKEKALYLYDDIKGNYERGVLIHEMVHALQDQHFGLKQLHQTSFSSDSDLARAALIEGDATYTMILLLEKEQPRVAEMLKVPLEKARNLQNAFLYAQGARYVKALKERGGWAVVNSAYRFPPRTTAAILHPEGVSTINLGPGKTQGQFGLITMLAAHPKTAPLAVQAAAGWKGDRWVEEGPAKWGVVAFGTREQAERFRSALATLRQAQEPDLQSAAGMSNVWQRPKGGIVAVLARDERVLSVEAPDLKAYQALLDRIEGPPAMAVYSRKDKRLISFGEMVERLLEADLVCIGESHDSELHHKAQLQVIKALFARDERLGVGMEMFQRPYQGILDRYFKGELTEEKMLEATEYRKRWGYDWSLYRPIVEFCRRNAVPLAALNVGRELTGRVSKVGYDALTEDEKKQLGPIDFHVKEHRAHWYERLAQMHGKARVSDDQKERSYQVMTVWDEYMADSAARFQQQRLVRRLVVLAGSGHIDRGFGLPDRAARRTGGKAVTIGIEVGTEPGKISDPPTDYVIVVR